MKRRAVHRTATGLVTGLICWLTAATLPALSIELHYDAPLSQAPSFDPAGTRLQNIVRAAADIWEATILDDATLQLAFTWGDLDDATGTLGVEATLGTFGGRPTITRMRFDTLVAGQERNWFVDPTPDDQSEFAWRQTLVADLSSTARANAYDGSPPDLLETSLLGQARDIGAGSAVNRFDLLSVVLHEMGHAIGLADVVAGSETNDGDYDVPPSFVDGATMAIKTFSDQDRAHLAAPNALMFPSFPPGVRRLPSATDILAIATSAGWSQIALPRDGRLGDMNRNGVVDFDDIDAFVLGLTNAADYTARFGVPAAAAGDLSLDGQFDFDDIPGLVDLLGASSQAGVARTVPEPAAGALALLAIMLGLSLRVTVRGGRQ